MDNSKIWEEVLEKIKENITPISFETWFKPLQIRKIDRDLNIVYIEISADKRNDFITAFAVFIIGIFPRQLDCAFIRFRPGVCKKYFCHAGRRRQRFSGFHHRRGGI